MGPRRYGIIVCLAEGNISPWWMMKVWIHEWIRAMSQDWIRFHMNGLALIKEGLSKPVPPYTLVFMHKVY